MEFLKHLQAQGISNPDVLRAMESVPRAEFLPEGGKRNAGVDGALPIGWGQTISQPSLVALMTQTLVAGGKNTGRVLEVGTGSGYQAAILSRLAREVFTMEIVEPLAERARATLARLGIGNVRVRTGDAHAGWPEEAPFDAIMVTCAPERVPDALVAQLREGGRMVIPVGGQHDVQWLLLVEKIREAGVGGGANEAGGGARLRQTRLEAVRFVPMTGGNG